MEEGKDFVFAEHNIPEWSLCYIANGDRDNLTDEEVAIVDEWLEKTFPKGFVLRCDFDDYNELDISPAFGHRNPNALVRRGEPAYFAVKTYNCQFLKLL